MPDGAQLRRGSRPCNGNGGVESTSGWHVVKRRPEGQIGVGRSGVGIEEHFDVERSARDQITRLVLARFKGHGMAELVGAILRAQGFSTHISPPGPDGGIDILAAPGTFGFSEPRICVQVKSQQSPIERTVLDALGGVMKKVNATHGLLVCWGGFKSSIDRDETQQFFHVRLWDADDLIDELLGVYDKLDADLRALVPLKRVWTLAAPEET